MSSSFSVQSCGICICPNILLRSVLHPLHQLYSSPVIDPSRLTYTEAELREAIPVLMRAHGAIKAASEVARAAKVLGPSLQSSIVLEMPETKEGAVLAKYAEELEAMFVVSSVEINGTVPVDAAWKYSEQFDVDGAGTKGTAWVLPPKQHKCARCWRYVAPAEESLCGRCEEAVAGVD